MPDWKPETWIAIYAAIVGTGALLLNFKTWFDSGVKLHLSLVPTVWLLVAALIWTRKILSSLPQPIAATHPQ